MVFGYTEQMDAFIRMQLTDLAQTLARMPELTVDLEYASFFDHTSGGHIGISQCWTGLSKEDEWEGQKSDVYLRAAGSARYSDAQAIDHYLTTTRQGKLPKFAKQMLAIGEEVRLEQLIVQERSGTSKTFIYREKLLSRFLHKQAKQSMESKDSCGLLLCYVYFYLRGKHPVPWENEMYNMLQQKKQLQKGAEVLPLRLKRLKDAKTTHAVAHTCMEIVAWLEENDVGDTNIRLFDIRAAGVCHHSNQTGNEYLTAKTKVREHVVETNDRDQLFPSWPRETKETETTGLSDPKEQESQSGISTNQGRLTSFMNDQMMFGQGKAGAEAVQRSSVTEQVSKYRHSNTKKTATQVDKINAKAETIWVNVPETRKDEQKQYARYAQIVHGAKRKLTASIQKYLNHKHNEKKERRMAGRLGKKLIQAVTDDKPKLFYKKHDPGRELDAAFILLVDCSASMYDKIEETKKGIVLFHEALQTLRIPHQITGFWEDAPIYGEQDRYPNYFQTVVPFSRCLQQNIGASIMSLSPKQDNRDGYAIREMTNILRKRAERHKFLIVFSDGEPAAAEYFDAGILDTYRAVLEARRQGIDVIGVFLGGDGEIKDNDTQFMNNIYGKANIIVPSVAQLQMHLSPLLRKLLYKAIHT